MVDSVKKMIWKIYLKVQSVYYDTNFTVMEWCAILGTVILLTLSFR